MNAALYLTHHCRRHRFPHLVAVMLAVVFVSGCTRYISTDLARALAPGVDRDYSGLAYERFPAIGKDAIDESMNHVRFGAPSRLNKERLPESNRFSLHNYYGFVFVTRLIKALERFPENAYAWLYLGYYADLLDRPESAVTAACHAVAGFQAVLAYDDLALPAGAALCRDGSMSFDSLLRQLDAQTLMRADSGVVRSYRIALYNLALFQVTGGYLDEGQATTTLNHLLQLGSFNDTTEVSPYRPAVLRLLAEAKAWSGDQEVVSSILADARKISDTTIRKSLTRSDDPDKLLLIGPKREAERLRIQGILHTKREEFALAAEFFEQSLDRNPDLRDVRYSLATALDAQGRREEAMRVINALIDDLPLSLFTDDAYLRPERLYFLRGNILYREGNFEDAAQNFEQATTLRDTRLVYTNGAIEHGFMSRSDPERTSIEIIDVGRSNRSACASRRWRVALRPSGEIEGDTLENLRGFVETLLEEGEIVYGGAHYNRGNALFEQWLSEDTDSSDDRLLEKAAGSYHRAACESAYPNRELARAALGQVYWYQGHPRQAVEELVRASESGEAFTRARDLFFELIQPLDSASVAIAYGLLLAELAPGPGCEQLSKTARGWLDALQERLELDPSGQARENLLLRIKALRTCPQVSIVSRPQGPTGQRK